MLYKTPKVVLCATLTVALLFFGACTTELSGHTSSIPKEAKMDLQTKHEVQMLIDAFPDGVEYFEKTVVYSVEAMRENRIESFVSVKIVPDEEISDRNRRIGIDFMLDITDDTGVCYRAGFSRNGLIVMIYIPGILVSTDPDIDGTVIYAESIAIAPPPVI